MKWRRLVGFIDETEVEFGVSAVELCPLLVGEGAEDGAGVGHFLAVPDASDGGMEGVHSIGPDSFRGWDEGFHVGGEFDAGFYGVGEGATFEETSHHADGQGGFEGEAVEGAIDDIGDMADELGGGHVAGGFAAGVIGLGIDGFDVGEEVIHGGELEGAAVGYGFWIDHGGGKFFVFTGSGW